MYSGLAAARRSGMTTDDAHSENNETARQVARWHMVSTQLTLQIFAEESEKAGRIGLTDHPLPHLAGGAFGASMANP
jgi:hypothetical protein